MNEIFTASVGLYGGFVHRGARTVKPSLNKVMVVPIFG